MNYSNYESNTGDRIDLIVLKHYGSLEHLNTVIAHNKHLFDKSMDLKSGTTIQLPIIIKDQATEQETVSKKREPLW